MAAGAQDGYGVTRRASNPGWRSGRIQIGGPVRRRERCFDETGHDSVEGQVGLDAYETLGLRIRPAV